MISYTIYTPMFSIMLGFACFVYICKILCYKPQACDYKMFLRLNESKKLATKAQNDPTWTYRGKHHNSRRFRKKQQKENGGGLGQEPPRVGRGGHHGPW